MEVVQVYTCPSKSGKCIGERKPAVWAASHKHEEDVVKTANGLTVGEKKAVDKLIRGLRELYGANLSRVILYGSKARGDATEDSDVDVMVMLRDYRDWNAEFDKVSELVNAVMEDYNYDLLISFVIKKEEDYSAGLTPLLLNVRKEGVSLWAR